MRFYQRDASKFCMFYGDTMYARTGGMLRVSCVKGPLDCLRIYAANDVVKVEVRFVHWPPYPFLSPGRSDLPAR